ncbi:MAG: serpin family protein [Saprospiraceae bacterium]|nr:serpin family protein [Saprospiraceae bacterium]MDZ4706687.1 serpin family protein [Saprospiraceae bacterium]
MNKLFFLFGTFALFLALACKDEVAPSPPLDLTCISEQQVPELSRDNNAFGFDLLKKLQANDPDGNLFISPLSIAAALSMTLNGAAGDTKTAMQQTMRLSDWEIQQLNSAWSCLLEVLPQLDADVDVNIANSIWYKQGFTVRQEFLDANTQNYNSEVAALNFGDPAALTTINGWVDQKTNGLIETILDEIPANAVMYLINAIYFKGAWRKEFDPEYTTDATFHLEDGSQQPIKMMTHGQTTLPYFTTSTFDAVDLAYADSIYSMSIFLPKAGVSVNDLANILSESNWNTWLDSFQSQEMFFSMPKFKMEYKEKLNRSLTQMGMGIAFGSNADFSGINGTGGLYIDEAIHKSFIEVNEEGTEAAAVTSIGIVETSMPSIPIFYADRPFLFAIRENKTGSILFFGKLMDPS